MSFDEADIWKIHPCNECRAEGTEHYTDADGNDWYLCEWHYQAMLEDDRKEIEKDDHKPISEVVNRIRETYIKQLRKN